MGRGHLFVRGNRSERVSLRGPRTRCSALLGLIALVTASHLRAAEPADLLVLGDIYTVDGARSWQRVLAVDGGKIVYIGPETGSEPYRGESTRVITLEPGQMVTPGIQDSHVHLLDGGLDQLKCDLLNLKTPGEVIEALEACIAKHPKDPWILATGWAPPLFPEGNPNKADLDKILPDRPAWLASQDEHSDWANSAALKLAGIDKDTPQPPRGRIERDPKTGEPSGTLRESAMNLVEDIVPKPEDPVWEETVLSVQKMANGLGITSIQEANFVAPSSPSPGTDDGFVGGGWDIECLNGKRKYEVKGRKDGSTEILLTPNEYKQAKRYGCRIGVSC